MLKKRTGRRFPDGDYSKTITSMKFERGSQFPTELTVMVDGAPVLYEIKINQPAPQFAGMKFSHIFYDENEGC